MLGPPTARVQDLERLLARIRNAGNIQLNYDMWDSHGREHATDEERAAMERDFAAATRERDAARTALTALVTATRAEAPAELVAWADAHAAYLAAFAEACEARGEAGGTARAVALDEQAAWAEVRAGTRPFVDENLFYVTMDADRYRRLFGIEPDSLEPAAPSTGAPTR